MYILFTSQEYTEDESDEDDDELPVWAIVLIALACATVLIVLVAFLLYRYYFSKRCESTPTMHHPCFFSAALLLVHVQS